MPARSARWLLFGILFFCAAELTAEEKVLFDQASRFNRVLVTEDDQGRRILRFGKGKPVQTVAKVGDPELQLPYVRAMPIGMGLVDNPQNALFVGLGGGSLPTFIHRHYPQLKIDAVELDPLVVKVAKEYFNFRETPTLRVHVGDGRKFIEQGEQRYDVIFLDAYGEENIPYSLATREFLTSVRGSLRENGVVIANVLGPASNKWFPSMVRTYQEVFDALYILEIRESNNRILIASPTKRWRGVDIARRGRQVSREKKLRYDLADFVLNGFRHPGKQPDARVLLDRDRPVP